ncbi:MAG: ankyrin repeat domain-containing protein [Gallionellaceae bacterium]
MRISLTTVSLLISVVILSGCASSLPQHVYMRDYKAATSSLDKGEDPNAEGNVPGTNVPIAPSLCQVAQRYKNQCPSGLGKWNWGPGGANCVATWEEQLDFAKRLIAKGANVNVDCYYKGYGPLAVAINDGNKEMVKLLVAQKVPFREATITTSYTSKVKITPLMYASSLGYNDIAQFLIDKGANPSQKSSEGKDSKDYYAQYLQQKRAAEIASAQRQQAAYEQQQRDKEDSKAFWKGAATLATGMAVGNATRNLDSGQQTRMMKSSMEAVDSGDASGFTETTRQVKAEQAQSHQAKMREIEAEKERERARAAEAQREREQPTSASTQNSQLSRAGNTDEQPVTSQKPRLHTTEVKNYRCVSTTTGSGNGATESEARAKALKYAHVSEGGVGNLKVIGSVVTSCKHQNVVGYFYICYAETKYEKDSSNPCSSGPREPSAGSAK